MNMTYERKKCSEWNDFNTVKIRYQSPNEGILRWERIKEMYFKQDIHKFSHRKNITYIKYILYIKYIKHLMNKNTTNEQMQNFENGDILWKYISSVLPYILLPSLERLIMRSFENI